MNSARRVHRPEGREAETHSEEVIFVKVGREPNRFESELFYKTPKIRDFVGLGVTFLLVLGELTEP